LTSPLVYVYAVAAGVLVVFFIAAGVLIYGHAMRRAERADALLTYIARTMPPASPHDDQRHPEPDDLVRYRSSLRAAVMHLTVGDVIRDDAVARAVWVGVAAGPGRRRGRPDGDRT
jgi:hypothetical protein